jgi:hypothetical protein
MFLILMLVAMLCFALSAAGVVTRINLVSSGLMFMALAFAIRSHVHGARIRAQCRVACLKSRSPDGR